MGRLKAWQNLNPLFSGKYKKLLEEYGSKDYSRLLLQESLQDYLSYACGQCGHTQKLQVKIYDFTVFTLTLFSAKGVRYRTEVNKVFVYIV